MTCSVGLAHNGSLTAASAVLAVSTGAQSQFRYTRFNGITAVMVLTLIVVK